MKQLECAGWREWRGALCLCAQQGTAHFARNGARARGTQYFSRAQQRVNATVLNFDCIFSSCFIIIILIYKRKARARRFDLL
jgi:hypothetical protein